MILPHVSVAQLIILLFMCDQYIRVDYETKIANLVKLLLHYWKMDTPKLLISVTGGAQHLTMKPPLVQVICHGLAKAAESRNTWIITGGTNTGVSKYVGKAVRDYKIKYGSKMPLVALGIATWGCIENRDDLIRNKDRNGESKEINGCWTALYKVTDSPYKMKESPLDPNHTHFILVDNGTQHKFGVEMELRARLESEISKMASYKKPRSIPMVCVVLGGDSGTLKTVKEAVMKGTPVVIVKDSGGAADVLTCAYWQWQQHKEQNEIFINDCSAKKEAQVNLWYEVYCEILKKFGSGLHVNDMVKYASDIRVCVEKSDLLSIFHLESGSSTMNIDSAILNAAPITSKVNPEITQLRSALTMDTKYAAEDKTFTEIVNFEEWQLGDLMFFAIQKNHVAFVKLFLEKGVGSFFEKKRFKERFKDLCKEVKTMYQKEMEQLLKSVGVKLLSYDCHNGSCIEDNPSLSLFIWSVLMMRREMALVFLSKRHKEYLALVVVAHLISCTLLRIDPDSELNKELSEQVTFYKELAVGLLNECHSSDRRKSIQLLVREIRTLGKTTALKMAVLADNKNFVAHPACQNLLTESWTGKLSDDNQYFKLVIAISCPFVAPSLLKFRDDSTLRSVSTTSDSSQRTEDSSQLCKPCATYFRKLCHFFQAPEIKFSYNFLSHLAFLLLYGIILLTDFYPTIGIKEMILIAWVATLIIEEIRQIIIIDEYCIRQKLYNYITDIWNIMDVITIVTFLSGMILRFIPVSICGQCFYAARIILALNFMMFSFRIIHVFSIHRELGPKLVMIGKMVIDLFYFMIILLVFITAYGITSHVILYPNQPLNIALARDVLSRSWWNIFGELGIDEVSGEACDNRTVLPYAEQCASMDANEFSSNGCGDYKADKCPAIDWLVPIILAIYVLITNVLMFNLLIAMFSKTLSDIQGQTNVVWKMQRYHLVREYESRPTLPPPLIILAHGYCLIRYSIRLARRICCQNNSVSSNDAVTSSGSSVKSSSSKNMDEELLNWETRNAEEYLRKRKPDDQEPDSKDTSDLILGKLEEMSIILSHQGRKVKTLKEEITRAMKEEIARALKEEIRRYQYVTDPGVFV